MNKRDLDLVEMKSRRDGSCPRHAPWYAYLKTTQIDHIGLASTLMAHLDPYTESSSTPSGTFRFPRILDGTFIAQAIASVARYLLRSPHEAV